jgi:hypothetical protein
MINNNMDSKKPITIDDLNVKYFKLMNGDSIVSYVHDNIEGGTTIGLEEPMKVSMDKNKQYCLSPYMPFTSDTVHHLDVFNILLESAVDNDIKAHYMRIVLKITDSNTISDSIEYKSNYDFDIDEDSSVH